MFGYVRIDAKNLRLRDYDCYRAVYCGLCRRMGKCTGQLSRLTLSYDFTFLSVLRMSLSHEPVKAERIHCPAKCREKKQAFLHSAQLDYCADAAAILTHHKCLDDKKDERGGKKLLAEVVGTGLSGGYRKARARHPDLDLAVKGYLSDLASLEALQPSPSPDRLAEVFGDLLGEIASAELPEKEARIARVWGSSIGKWIYLSDAIDDFEEDLKKGRFNPFSGIYGNEMTDSDRASVKEALIAILRDAERAFLLTEDYPAPEFREILANMLYLGLPATAEKILTPKGNKNE